MRRSICLPLLILSLSPWGVGQTEPAETSLVVEGVTAPVRIQRDRWGVAHIFAENEHDLFFAQGYNAAHDRLFQLELWRRRATGTVAEILGEDELAGDIGARLLRFRGSMTEELSHYHPRGASIIGAFVEGINAYVRQVKADPTLLPMEFRLLGIVPGEWTPEVVVSRHNGLFRNARDEVRFARLVEQIGVDKLKELVDFRPVTPTLEESKAQSGSIPENALDRYRASRGRIRFKPEHIVRDEWRGATLTPVREPEREAERGSNNWVVAPGRSFTSAAWMANDPHRSLQLPSLRYFVHLSAPGWNVIGGGEPALPGISIGHNDFGAWGLTIFSVDQEDLYVYQTDPSDPSRYRYRGEWESMREVREQFKVKGRPAPVDVTLRFTRHGPVLYEDADQNRAYGLRAAWLETGTAPYLASLRFNQARSWEEFQEACSYFLAPSENMVWADLQGNIGWQATGITPLRPNWSGLLPVPGDGSYEWQGYLPGEHLPFVYNPPEGFFATANQNNLPPGYPHPVGYRWTDPYRFSRLQEELSRGDLKDLGEMIALQQDVLSIPARQLVPLLQEILSDDAAINRAISELKNWDFRMEKNSIPAAIYQLWQGRLVENTWRLHLPEEVREDFPMKSLAKAVSWLLAPDGRFGEDPLAGRRAVLTRSLEEALAELEHRFGQDWESWRYGDSQFHHVQIEHPLSGAVRADFRSRLNAGPLPRGGNRETVEMTTASDNQSSGASFRVIVDLSDWDRSLATNTPGQSGNPESPHYRDLFDDWAAGRYFPIFFSRKRIDSVTESVILLEPVR